MNFMVLSRDEIEEGIVVRTPYLVISIYDSNSKPATLIRGSGFVDALFVQFDDTDPKYSFGKRPMTLKQGKRIWDFVQSHQNQVGTIVIHCLAGMSRSPAIALALSEKLEVESSYWRQTFNCNEHVYQTMTQAITQCDTPEA